MATLRTIFESAGFADVTTVLNSGNVVFASDSVPDAAALESRILAETGVNTRLIVLDAARLERVVQDMPFAGDESRLVISVADGPPPSASAPDDLAPEQVQVGPDAIYQHCPDGISKSKLTLAFWKQFSPETTARNLRTMKKLLALVTHRP